MTYLNDTNPALDDVLAHYGKKGMKWGVRSAPRKSAPTAREVYRARENVVNEKLRLRSKRKSIRSAKTSQTKVKRKAEYADMKLKFLNNPDRATQLRITKGDLAMIAILNVATAGIATGPTVAGAGVRVGARKTIEKRQKSGDYNRVARNRAFNARNAAR